MTVFKKFLINGVCSIKLDLDSYQFGHYTFTVLFSSICVRFKYIYYN